jgi:hypothetical protein
MNLHDTQGRRLYLIADERHAFILTAARLGSVVVQPPLSVHRESVGNQKAHAVQDDLISA